MQSDGQQPSGDAPGNDRPDAGAQRGPDREHHTPASPMDPNSFEPRSTGFLARMRRAAAAPLPTERARPAGLTEDGRLKSGRLAGLTMNRAIWVLSWPILIDSLLHSLVGLTDTVLAAELGEPETDAIGGASYIAWFIGLTAMAIGVGSTALVSRAVGKGRMAVAHAAVGQTIIMQVVAGTVVGSLIALLAEELASALSMTPEAARAFRDYMWIIAAGVPLLGVQFGLIACARGAGDAKRPLMVMAIVNLVNILVSWSLVGRDLTRTRFVDGEARVVTLIENPFAYDMGVQGIALGTLIAQAVGATLMILLMAGGASGVRLKARRLRPHWHTIRRLIRLAVPNYLETFGLWFGNGIVLLMVGRLGAGALGAHIVAIRIEALSFTLGFAMGTAAATLVGQYLGAGSPRLAQQAVVRCAAIAGMVMGGLGLLFLIMPRTIVGLLTSQPAHIETAPRLVFICGLVQLPFALAIVFRAAIRGAGDVRAAMTMTWVLTYALRLPLVFLLSGVVIPLGEHGLASPLGFEPSLTGVWIALCSELLIRGVAFTTRFFQGAWARKVV